MRVLALDHGVARFGCAISDPTGTVVRPLPVIAPPDPEAVKGLIDAEGVEKVVLGLPRSLGGGEGEQARLVREFGAALRRLTDAEIEFYDERFTTKLAQTTRRSGARAAEDSLAAAHLLEDYLNRSTPVGPTDSGDPTGSVGPTDFDGPEASGGPEDVDG